MMEPCSYLPRCMLAPRPASRTYVDHISQPGVLSPSAFTSDNMSTVMRVSASRLARPVLVTRDTARSSVVVRAQACCSL